MKKVNSLRKVLISLCIAAVCFCCLGFISAQQTAPEVQAATTSSVSMKLVSNSNTTTLDYVYIYFEGFNTKVNYDEPGASDDYAFRNIYINGTSIHDINKNTDVSDWSWDIFPQTEQPGYRKPVIHYIGTTGSTNKYMEIRIHKNYVQSVLDRDGYFTITVAEGFTVNGYITDKATTYRLKDDGSAYVNAEVTPTVDWRGSYDNSSSIDYFYIGFKGFLTKDDYEGNANSDYVFQNILVNDRSIYDINATTDVTGWEWNTFPQNESSLPQFKKPVIGYIKDTNGRIQLRIHKNLTNALLSRDGHVHVTVKKGFSLGGYVVPSDTVFEIASVQDASSPITVDTWNKYPTASHLYYAHLNFEGFNVQDDYSGDSNSDSVLKAIKINGRSIYEINATTSVDGWTWEIFPQPEDAKYRKPILTYTKGQGYLELRIHKKFYDSIIAEYGALDISVDKGFIVNGYRNTQDFKAVKNSAGVFVAPTVIDASTVSVSRWQPMSNVKLNYFDINYAGFPVLDYQVMDVATYAYIENMIMVNGEKLSVVNSTTDISGWEWLNFPSTIGAIYQRPFVHQVYEGRMELRMHDNYWAMVKDEGLKIDLLPGYYIENDGKLFVLDQKVSFVKDLSVVSFDTENPLVGWEETQSESSFQMVDGASVRLTSDSGIRFTAKIEKSYLDELTASGKTYKFMMQINRENSEKTAQVECSNFYEEKGFVYFSVAIVNLNESSLSLTYTARPYLIITDGEGAQTTYYTQKFLVSRKISEVAYMAYTDISATYDEEKYPYEVYWEGKTQYSPYTSSQRDILAGFIIDGVITADGIYKFNNESDKNFLMKSDNDEVNAFFDEYADRFVYYYKDFASTGDYVTDTVVGNASMSWKDWEAESILFMDTLHLNGNDDQLNRDIQNAKVDKYGYVWEGDSFFGQGWNSPTYIGSRANVGEAFLSDGWEFVNGRKNSSILDADSGAFGKWGASSADWSASGDGTFASATDSTRNNGAGYYLGHAVNSSYFIFSVEDNNYGGNTGNGLLQAAHSPFIEIGLDFVIEGGSVSEIYLEFKVERGSYISLPLSTWATTEIDYSNTESLANLRLYVPVFEHPSWTGTITGLRIRVTGKNLSTHCYLDFVRGSYDTRMIDSNTSFISAGKQHFENTGNIAFLTQNITNYRKALAFLTNYMVDNGLINLSNFVGHDGSAQGFGTSFISTYWDIVSLAPNSSYVNALYYKALCNMAYLEDALTANGVSVEKPTVKTTLTGADIAYDYTASELRQMASTVKSAISANLNESEKTGYFKTFTVTLNGEQVQAGRFIEGYYGSTQIDFGAVALNLMILESGVATDAQKALVMNWIASIDNLYEYVFAPKTNTENIVDQYCWAYSQQPYGVSCQNGGAILFVSYYDLLARAQAFGVENAYQRLAEIMEWFKDVGVAFEQSGSDNAKDFFLPYYDGTGLTLQGRSEEGTLGLHAEFVENAILYSSVPTLFFGLDTYYGANGLVMKVAPTLPEEIGTWKMEQVRYAGVVFDIAVGNDFVVLCNLKEKSSGALSKNTTVEVTLSYTGDSPKVYINNKLVNSGYTVNESQKTVTVTVALSAVNVSVR